LRHDVGRLSPQIPLILTGLLLVVVIQPPASAVVGSDEGGDDCVVVSRTDYRGDEWHADLYFSDVTFDDGDLMINGDSFDKTLIKEIERLQARIAGDSNGSGGPSIPDPTHGPPPQNALNQLNPILNPFLDTVVGPILRIVEDLDPQNLPTIQIEMYHPSPVGDIDGNRVALFINTPACLSA
jgi:hypothetical protein